MKMYVQTTIKHKDYKLKYSWQLNFSQQHCHWLWYYKYGTFLYIWYNFEHNTWTHTEKIHVQKSGAKIQIVYFYESFTINSYQITRILPKNIIWIFWDVFRTKFYVIAYGQWIAFKKAIYNTLSHKSTAVGFCRHFF